ncbi:hypothetical protein WA158_001502 [Blastocystis sp. Blastoise]
MNILYNFPLLPARQLDSLYTNNSNHWFIPNDRFVPTENASLIEDMKDVLRDICITNQKNQKDILENNLYEGLTTKPVKIILPTPKNKWTPQSRSQTPYNYHEKEKEEEESTEGDKEYLTMEENTDGGIDIED